MAKKRAFDKVLFTTVVILTVFGLVMVFSATAPRAPEGELSGLVLRQSIAAGIGLLAMGVAMHVDYRQLARPAVINSLVGLALVLLVAALFQPTLNEARRWIFIGSFSFQPSELAKLVLVPFLAFQISRRDGEVNRADFLVPVTFVVGLMAALVLVEPDLGTAGLMLAVAALMIFLAGLSWRWVALATAGLASLATVAVFAAPYRRDRFSAFLDPEADPLGHGYQALQSLIAVGSGGLLGRGPGDSVQKLAFLPQAESDFIFSIIAEELGLIGALVLLVAFSLLLWRGVKAALAAPDPFGRYLGLGLTALLVLQALLNISVAVSVLPTTGITLPFISYGGSSLIATLTASGVLLNLSEHG